MNSMTNLTESSVTSTAYTTIGSKTPFKKLFPVDSIVKTFRPQKAGIKYAIVGDVAKNTYRDPKTLEYDLNYRTYYPGETNSYKYWITPKDAASPYIAISYPKDIVTNKIVIKFEISHSIPPTWDILTTGAGVTNLASGASIKSGTSSDIGSFSSSKPGLLALYYTGSAWVTDETKLNTSAYQTIRTIKLSMGQITGYAGVIELSPRWVKDISETVKSFSLNKESSSSQDDIVPVGNVTANSLTMDLIKYNSSYPEILSYDISDSVAIEPSRIYVYENSEISPYLIVYHENGLEGTSPLKYDKVWQGKFYIADWTDSEFNDISIVALDSAKFLQEIVAPPILSQDFSVVSVIRQMLDNIGFTSYNFNLQKNESDIVVDKSIITMAYWWTEDNQTVWDVIQELCRDTQMTAFFDEDNILQFYSREYMYDPTRTESWILASESVGSYIPNIIDLSKNKVPTANQIKILWESAITSDYGGDLDPIWSADPSFLLAAALTEDLTAETGVGGYMKLSPVSIQNDFNPTTGLAFSGYFAINNEIIQYDAVQYEYEPSSAPGTRVSVDIENASDIAKSKGLAVPSSTAFKPNGKYRIKERGAFGTGPAKLHSSKYDASAWNVNRITIS